MEGTFENEFLPLTTITSGLGQSVVPDLYCLPIQIVNVCFFGYRDAKEWVLVDAGMPRSADTIINAAEKHFGTDRPPKAIILTHGHFDHVGALIEGEAFVTVKSDELFKSLIQLKELHGPPVYYTLDWQAAWDSVKKLAALQPSVAVTGH